MPTPLLKLENVVKSYQNHLAVNHVSFEVPEGSVFGLLGPNGAGKTSLIRIITTITRADSGQVYLQGRLLDGRHPDQIGYMPEERGLYKKMRVGEHLLYLAQLKGLTTKDAQRALEEWFEKFDITSWKHKKVEELSKGMQQKVQFIATVVHQPKLLILDEPFSGLDPINAQLIQSEIDELNKKGATIIFSTHRMEQVEQICERIVLINKGRNILEGKVRDIRRQYKENLFELEFEGSPLAAGDGEFAARFKIVSQKQDKIIVQLNSTTTSNDLLLYCVQKRWTITGFREILPTLNEIFIKQVGASNE